MQDIINYYRKVNIDKTLLVKNLSLTVEERFLQLQAMVDFAKEMKKAKEKQLEKKSKE